MPKPTIEEMLAVAQKAMKNAYNPYSKFSVGACILADDGKLYAGCNIENASYRLTICAEASAVAAMITQGAKQIERVVITADSENIVVPCGACRQTLREFASLSTPVYMFNKKGQSMRMTIDELLPKSFGASYFLEE